MIKLRQIGVKVLFFAFFSIAFFVAGIKVHQAIDVDPLPQVIQTPDLNKPFDFAGEPIPHNNNDVLERLDREIVSNSYLHGSTIMNLKLSARYFPMITKILEAEGIPDDFKYLVPVESEFRNATSPAGAKGIWQIMASTAKDLGLEVNQYVDERFHPEKATLAACKHIKWLYNQLGSWTLVAAAYNGGGGRIKKELANQQVQSFYDLWLNAETSRYVFRILAFKDIMEHPGVYGFQMNPKDLYQPLNNLSKVTVDQSIPDLVQFAKEHGTTYRDIRLHNPWILGETLPVTPNKSYQIVFPVRK